MIKFKRNGNTVVATIDSGIGWTYNFKFTVSDGNEGYAELLLRQLQDNKSNVVGNIRKSAYLAGLKAGRAREKCEPDDWGGMETTYLEEQALKSYTPRY